MTAQYATEEDTANTMKQIRDYAEFRSPFEELESSSKQSSMVEADNCEQTTPNEYSKRQSHKVEEQWQPAFPIQQNQKPSPVHSETEEQSFQEQLKQQQKSIQSLLSDGLDDLSLSFYDISLSSEDLNIKLQSPDNVQSKKINKQRICDKHSITQDLIDVFQQLPEEGKGKVLSSKKSTEMIWDQEQMLKQDKIVAARAFINRGYGINQLKDELRTGKYGSLKIDECRYKSVAGSMVRQSFRHLEAFLVRDCKQKLHSMSSYEMKLLQTLLLNCRTTLPPLQSKYFMQIVSITYNLTPSSIYQTQCFQLYNAIYKALMKKVAMLRGQRHSDSYSSDQRPKRCQQKNLYSGSVDNAVITPAVQRQIITQYISVQSLSQVRDAVRSKYTIDESKLNVKVIRNIMRRVMRAAIRKIEYLVAERGLKTSYGCTQKFSDERIKHILEGGDGSPLRSQLCKAHLNNFRDSKQVERINRELWQFVSGRKRQISSIQLD